MKRKLLTLLTTCCSFAFSQPVMDWVVFSAAPNKMVYCFSNYNNQLVAAGMFDSIGNSKYNRIASWDGSSWSSLGSGLKGKTTGFGNFVYDSRVYNNELYVYGSFDSAGTVACKNIAKWNGTTWTGFGSGSDTAIFATAMYNNDLYAAGAFKNIGGVQANFIAKWDGNLWQPVGNNSLKGEYVSALYVFQNQLFAAGAIDSVNGNKCNYVARWNGTVWDTVAGGLKWNPGIPSSTLNEPKFAFIEWNNQLLIGSVSYEMDWDYSIEIHQWNGIAWSLFSLNSYSGFGGTEFAMTKVRKFFVYNNTLYAAGGIGWSTAGTTVFKWDASLNKWQGVGKGIGSSTRGLGSYNGELFCGGSFDKAHGSYHNYFAKLANVSGLKNEKLKSDAKLFPNPVNDILSIQCENFEEQKIEIIISNALGQIVYSQSDARENEQIDLSILQSGIYFVNLRNPNWQKSMKLMKE